MHNLTRTNSALLKSRPHRFGASWLFSLAIASGIATFTVVWLTTRSDRDAVSPSNVAVHDETGTDQIWIKAVVSQTYGQFPLGEADRRQEEALDAWLSRLAKVRPQQFQQGSIAALNDHFSAVGVGNAAILIDDGGKCAIVVGMHEDRTGDPLLQVMQRGNRILACSPSDLVPLRFDSVWLLSPQPKIDTRLVEHNVQVDRRWQWLGLIDPNSPLSASMTITNTGQRTLHLGIPNGSCGCLDITPASTIEIAPGAQQSFNVRVAAGTSDSLMQSIRIPVANSGGKTLDDIVFLLCGMVGHSADIYPDSLDFGILRTSEDKIATRRFMLTETAYDHFAIRDVTSHGIPVEWTSSEFRLPTRRMRYDFEVSVSGSKLFPGNHRGDLLISTTSALQPEIRIPIQVRAVGAFEIIPRTVSFGQIHLGDETVRSAQVILTANEESLDFSVEITECPQWCRCKIISESDKVSVQLRAKPETVGIHEGDVRLTVQHGERQQSVLIHCVAQVDVKNL